MPRRLRNGLTIFGYFTAIGLLFFGYRYLEFFGNRERVSRLVPLITELTGAWTAAAAPPFDSRARHGASFSSASIAVRS